MLSKEVFIISGKRTPFGSFLGKLKDVSGTELATASSKATLEASNISPDSIDHVIVGNVIGSESNSIYIPRHLGLNLKIPVQVPALGVNILCGSGFQSWISASSLIELDQAQVVLACGVEQMSKIPFVIRSARDGHKMGDGKLEDLLIASLTDSYAGVSMAITAENLALEYKILRNKVDEYACLSQKRYKEAKDLGVFEKEISPITVKSKRGDFILHEDEHPRPDTTIDGLSKLKPLFKEEGVVTAGNSSGIVDGAASTILAGAEGVKKLAQKPIAKIINYASVGCDPKVMGIGPVMAIKKALKNANLNLDDMDLIEVNEAFSAQFLAVQQELDLDIKNTNVNGGAIAVGHPLGATGVRIMNHLAYELVRRDLELAVGSACIGGGQGISIIIKRV